MPIGALKNTLYTVMLPMMGKRCEWNEVQGGTADMNAALRRVLKRRRVVGACIQRFSRGVPTECYTAGYAALKPESRLVEADIFFRSASITKMVCALLIFRLQTLGKLNIYEHISDFLGYPVMNPYYPDAPITLGMALGHISSIVDSPAYFASFNKAADLNALLADSAAYMRSIPGMTFRYSNLAAGMIGCMLEKRFGESLEALAQRVLFEPLSVKATFDLLALKNDMPANSYRVLPFQLSFDAKSRADVVAPMSRPDPQKHYLLSSGNLYVTAPALATLTLAAWNGHEGFINQESLAQMHKPLTQWPERAVQMRHGMGLLQIDDPKICARPLWGHQGFAYGAVNGAFFDENGNGFAQLNSGASEQRMGHLSRLNNDLISLFFNE